MIDSVITLSVPSGPSIWMSSSFSAGNTHTPPPFDNCNNKVDFYRYNNVGFYRYNQVDFYRYNKVGFYRYNKVDFYITVSQATMMSTLRFTFSVTGGQGRETNRQNY